MDERGDEPKDKELTTEGAASSEVAAAKSDAPIVPDVAVVEPAPVAEAPGRRRWLHVLHIRPELLLPPPMRHKLGKASRITSLALLTVVIGGVSAGGWWAAQKYVIRHAQPVSRFTASIAPFQVLHTTPTPDQQDVLDGSKIVIDFSRPVDPSKLEGDFFVSPQVDGTFSQGANDKEAVFTPAVPFTSGVIVKAMIHGEFQSMDGSVLGADYSFGFTMATPNNTVLFQRNDFQDIVGSVAAGNPAKYTLQVGDGVAPSGKVTIYKADMQSLLDSIVYVDKTANDYTYSELRGDPINTQSMQAVQTVDGLKNGAGFTVSQGEGVYALVATSNGTQVGSSWLVVSSLGVIARQDDQQVVLAATSFGSDQPADVTATFYSLHNSVEQIDEADVNGLGTVPTSHNVDAIVAKTADGKQAFIPIATYLSLADLRAQKDLSTSHIIYGLTDRPTYRVGDAVKYAGFVRLDNDGQYTVPAAGTTLQLYAQGDSSSHLSDFTATVGQDGTINGELNLGSNYKPPYGASQNVQIYYAAAKQDNAPFDQPIASFTVTSNKPSNDEVQVAFSKSAYVASDSVTATVTGKTSTGSPLAGASVKVNIYAKQYYEGDPAQNQAAASYQGNALKGSPFTVTLNGSGQASVPVNVSLLPAGSSQLVTIQASVKDANGAEAGGGATVVVHEGNGVLAFGTSRSVVVPGGEVVARVYAKDLSGNPLAGAVVHYQLVANTYSATSPAQSATVASGQATADTNGLAEISSAIASSYTSSTTFDLKVWTGDASNNKITADNYYYIRSDSAAYSDVQLSAIDVSGSPTDVQIGQTMNLTVNAPYDIHALISLERGRIHKYEMVDLHQGNNTYTISVTPDLAPSFSLVFSYFHDGNYNVEGATYNVPPAGQRASLTLMTDKSSYTAGSTATITLSAKDAGGNPLATDVVLGVVGNNVFNLNDSVTPDMFTFLYGPREITTNSSSSLTGVGSGGGKCGGGGYDQPDLLNPLGTTISWKPTVSTDASGKLTTSVKLPVGTWRIYAYTMSADSQVGATELTVVTK